MKRMCRLAITAAPQVSEALTRALLEATAVPPDLTDTMGDPRPVDLPLVDLPEDCKDRDD